MLRNFSQNVNPSVAVQHMNEAGSGVDNNRLLRSHTVQELGEVERNLRCDAEAKQSELRQTIGKRYPELLSAVDVIQHLTGHSRELLACVSALRHSIDEANHAGSLLGSLNDKLLSSDTQIAVSKSLSLAESLESLDDSLDAVFESMASSNSLKAAQLLFDIKQRFLRAFEQFQCRGNQERTLAKRISKTIDIAAKQCNSSSKQLLCAENVNDFDRILQALVAVYLLSCVNNVSGGEKPLDLLGLYFHSFLHQIAANGNLAGARSSGNVTFCFSDVALALRAVSMAFEVFGSGTYHRRSYCYDKVSLPEDVRRSFETAIGIEQERLMDSSRAFLDSASHVVVQRLELEKLDSLLGMQRLIQSTNTAYQQCLRTNGKLEVQLKLYKSRTSLPPLEKYLSLDAQKQCVAIVDKLITHSESRARIDIAQFIQMPSNSHPLEVFCNRKQELGTSPTSAKITNVIKTFDADLTSISSQLADLAGSKDDYNRRAGITLSGSALMEYCRERSTKSWKMLTRLIADEMPALMMAVNSSEKTTVANSDNEDDERVDKLKRMYILLSHINAVHLISRTRNVSLTDVVENSTEPGNAGVTQAGSADNVGSDDLLRQLQTALMHGIISSCCSRFRQALTVAFESGWFLQHVSFQKLNVSAGDSNSEDQALSEATFVLAPQCVSQPTYAALRHLTIQIRNLMCFMAPGCVKYFPWRELRRLCYEHLAGVWSETIGKHFSDTKTALNGNSATNASAAGPTEYDSHNQALQTIFDLRFLQQALLGWQRSTEQHTRVALDTCLEHVDAVDWNLMHPYFQPLVKQSFAVVAQALWPLAVESRDEQTVVPPKISTGSAESDLQRTSSRTEAGIGNRNVSSLSSLEIVDVRKKLPFLPSLVL